MIRLSCTGPRVASQLAAALSLVLFACSDPGPGPGGAPHFSGAKPEGPVAERLVESLMIEDSIERVAAVASQLADLGGDAVPQVVAAYEYARPVLGDSEWMLLADWWTRIDDRAAYAWATSSYEHSSPGLIRYVIAGIARNDPQRALLTLSALSSAEQRDLAFDEIVRAWYERDPDGVVDYLVGMSPGRTRQRALSRLVAVMLRRQGVDATRGWAESLDDDLPERFKLQTFRRVGSELARVDAAQARRWAEDHGQEPMGRGVYRRVAVVTALDDPEDTMRWLQGLPPGRERNEAVEEGYRRWLQSDREAALRWMQQAPDEPWRQPALEVYALARGVEDPETALGVAQRLTDPERRGYAQAKILVAWFARDDAAAEAWLADADLSEDLRRKIRDRVERNELQRRKRAARAEERRLRIEQRAAAEP